MSDEFDTDPEDYASEEQSQVSRPSNGATSSNSKDKNSKEKVNYETKSN